MDTYGEAFKWSLFVFWFVPSSSKSAAPSCPIISYATLSPLVDLGEGDI